MSNIRLLIDLTLKDFKKKYVGSYLGILWAFVTPIITIGVFWFVFEVGFKSAPVDNFPFILWLTCGMIPWFFITDVLNNGTNSVIENDYLVKKVVFKVELLPLVKVISGLVIHFAFIIFVIGIFLSYGYSLDLYSLQIIYYCLAVCVLVTGIIFISSALIIFLKDIGQIISVILQFGFWLTPIFWSLEQIPEKYNFYLKLNPFYYIINGYREALIYKTWFWEHPYLTIYFWTITIIMLIIGRTIFRRLRPHFADSL
ncbi:ABC transporter permease [Lysinibacillus fusiformis]|uniref:Transport permease protein n=1 Tax=Lysinibacillus fusiformis TaxID=28031 RepID=A0A1E4R2U9_9BACI|nr:ABC transporter permease [Lysinibacillus fusiformis]ODV54786.1 teichoic acid ABC transporter permease [Lysinibacillus fusiformis]